MYKLYTDGSYNKFTNKYAYGFVLLEDNYILCKGRGSDIEKYNAWQVTGELTAVREGLKKCKELNIKEVTIFYDYKGVEEWAEKNWKANKEISQKYVHFMDKARQFINIHFHKVKGHSGDTYNEMADQLANQALKE